MEDIYTAINFLTEKYQDHASLDRAILNIAEDYLLLAKSNDKLGQAEMAEQNYVKSLNLFNKIIQEMPDSQYQPHAHYMGGTCHVKLLQFAQGVEYYQMVVDNWPDFMYAGSAQSLVASYTRIRRDRGDIPADQADPLIQFACENIIANYKNCPTPHVYELALKRLGGLHMKHGRWEEAARYYETYRMEFPQFNTTSIILYNLAQIYESMGEPALAIDVCEEFIQTCPDDRRIDRIIAKWEELTAAN